MLTHVAYCPRCDKAFPSDVSKAAAMAQMEDHLKRNHPESIELYDEDL